MKRLGLAAAVVLVMSTSAPAAPQSPADFDSLVQALDREVDKLLLPAKKPVEDWANGGLNVEDLLRTEDGRQLLLFEPDSDAPTAIAYDVPVADLLPRGWYPVKSRSLGLIPRQGRAVTVVAISPTMVMVASGASRRVGGADCGSPDSGLELATYRHPQATGDLTDLEAGLQFFVDRYLSRFATADVCTVTRPASRRRYKMTYFASDGRPLSALNKDAKLSSIHPVSMLPSLLKLQP